MKKIAIFGPINSRGGRELETAFIASTLMAKYDLSVYSTEQVLQVNDIHSVNPEIDIYYKHKSFFSKLKSKFGFKSSYKRLLFKQLNGAKVKTLHDAILNVDLVFIMAQLTSNYTKAIIIEAKNLNKPIIFRTTGTIPKIDIKAPFFNYLKDVNLFINHSEKNSDVFIKNNYLNYKIIDQCVINEDEFLDKCPLQFKEIKDFYCVSRLDDNKDVITAVKAFNTLENNSNLKLHIIGEGECLNTLKSASTNQNIKFYGHLEQKDLIKLIYKFHCLIITSKEEAGPLTGLEAAILGLPIISTKVGAMPERFINNNSMWYKVGDFNELALKVLEYSGYSTEEIQNLQKENKMLYKQNFSKKQIAKQYLDSVSIYL